MSAVSPQQNSEGSVEDFQEAYERERRVSEALREVSQGAGHDAGPRRPAGVDSRSSYGICWKPIALPSIS